MADPWGGGMSEGSTGADGEKVGAELGCAGMTQQCSKKVN